MNNENYNYLREQVKMTGFGEALESLLKEKMASGEAEFSLGHQIRYGEKQMDFNLNFSKSKTQDNYFFNSYDATLTKPGETVSTRFYTDSRVTAKEAFNLLEGRSVEKKYNRHEKITDGDKVSYKPIKDSTYNTWLKLDINDADSNGHFKLDKLSFDMEKKLDALPIKQLLNDDDRAALINSLKKGNLHTVTFDINGENVTRMISANPRSREIGIYDQQGSPVKEVKQAAPKAEVSKEAKQGEKKSNAENVKNTAKKKAGAKQRVR